MLKKLIVLSLFTIINMQAYDKAAELARTIGVDTSAVLSAIKEHHLNLDELEKYSKTVKKTVVNTAKSLQIGIDKAAKKTAGKEEAAESQERRRKGKTHCKTRRS